MSAEFGFPTREYVTRPFVNRQHLTYARVFVTLGNMAQRLRRLDPERRRKRLALLAELASSRSRSGALSRERVAPRRVPADRVQELIALRRRLAD